MDRTTPMIAKGFTPENGAKVFAIMKTAPRSRRRRTAAAAAVVAAAALAAAGCSSANSTTTTTTPASTQSAAQADVADVTLHIGDQAGTGAQALLTAAGLIGKLPFKADWSDFTSGPPMLQAMGAGSVDVGGVGNAPPVFAAAGGDQLAIVGALQANPDGSALLVPKGSAIHDVQQLKGKRIAVAQGSSADYHLLTVLTKAGISVHDVTLVYLQPAAGLAALSSGHVDAWDIWSPFIEEGETLDGATAIVTGQGYGSPYSFTVASRAALADPAKAAAIRDYLALIAQAHRWANNHLSAWAAVWAKASGLPLTVMTKATADDSSVAVPITAAVIASEQQVANAFTASGLIPGHVNFANFVDTAYNATAGTAP